MLLPHSMRVDFSADAAHRFDKRLGIAALILLHSVERKEDRITEETERGVIGSLLDGLFRDSDS